MKIGVPKETADGERRVALIPDVVKSLKKNEKVDVVVESRRRRGRRAHRRGLQGGRRRGRRRRRRLGRRHRPPRRGPQRRGRSPSSNGNQLLISHLNPWVAADTNKALAGAGVTAFAMEAIPRTTRAQAMDALSSQAAAAGYAATLIGARESGRFFGMMTTAAGTVPPAKVLVLGAGVAGLQAVATAKRLGAIVTGFDIRRAAWEQIASLGGRPLELDFIPDAEGEGGYARPLTDEENAQVRDALAENAAKQDIIVTTAAIPGRPAPLLITAEAVRNMAPGSVIVDLAAETGGNCELTQPGQTVVEDGVKVIGPRNLPSEMPAPASQLYAKNLENLLGLIVTDEGERQGRLRGRHHRRRLHHPGRRDQEREGSEVAMSLMTEITIFVLAVFVGFEVISKVPTTLHTPLMSQTNAIHGIVMLGGLIVLGYADDGARVRDRDDRDRLRRDQHRRRLHGHRPDARHVRAKSRNRRPTLTGRAAPDESAPCSQPGGDAATALYIVAFSLFIIGIKQGTHPTTAKRGNLIAAGGMAVAVVTTLLLDGMGNWGLIVARPRDRHRGRRDRLDPRADDRDAADGRPLQRRRRRRRRPDRLVGDPPRDLARRGLPARRADPGHLRRRRRLGLLLGLEHRLRQAPGPDPDPADRGAGPAGDQRRPADRDRRHLRRSSRSTTNRPRRASSSSCWSSRRSSATSSCCRSAAPTCRS